MTYGGKVSSKPKVRIGLLTTASINRHLLATRGSGESYEFVGVASREHARAEGYARRWAIPRAYAPYEAMLMDKDIDAVYIALPNTLHYEWTIRALSAGKHVLCEKPFARDPAQVRHAFDVSSSAGLILSEAYMWRHNPNTRKIVELLSTIGGLRLLRMTFCFVLDRANDIRLVPELGGGALLDVGVYCISAARLLVGHKPSRVFGDAKWSPTGVDETVTAVLDFGDVNAEFTASFRCHHKSLEAIGENGSILALEPWTGNPTSLWLNGTEQPTEAFNSYRCELENFAASVRGEESPLLGRDEAIAQAVTLEAVRTSLESACPVAL